MPKARTHYKQVSVIKVKKRLESVGKSDPVLDNFRLEPAARKTEPYSMPLHALDGNGPLSPRRR